MIKSKRLASRLALFLCLAIGLLSGPPPHAQQQPQQPQQQTPQAAPPASPAKSEDQKKADQEKDKNNPAAGQSQDQTTPKNDRLFYALPNYLTVENAAEVPPLSTGEKYKMVAKSSFDYVEYPYIAALAGISQAENSEPGYGQGAAGYGKRFGSAFADNTVGNFMTGAVFPGILKQDPRYYQLGPGHSGTFHRIGYAIVRLFVTRTDSGGSQFNYSEIAGNAVAGAISNIYHPASDRTVGNTISVWWTEIMWDGAANEAKEFWPDLHHWISKKRARE